MIVLNVTIIQLYINIMNKFLMKNIIKILNFSVIALYKLDKSLCHISSSIIYNPCFNIYFSNYSHNLFWWELNIICFKIYIRQVFTGGRYHKHVKAYSLVVINKIHLTGFQS